MTDDTAETTHGFEENQTTAATSRRRLLKKGLATVGAIVGIGAASSTAGAENGRFKTSPGRGGEAVVPADDHRNEPFVITERTGGNADEIDGALFKCNEGNDGQIFLVGWHFEYADDDRERTLYTRSNNIETGLEYGWGGNGAKVCEDSGQTVSSDEEIGLPEDFVQTPYSATGPQ